MTLRWCVTGLAEAEKRFRRVKGFRTMPSLTAALHASLEGPQAFDTASEVA
ncbi:MAG: hypothetical protein ACC742_03935 [Thermoanaerobaculales bacterium]